MSYEPRTSHQQAFPPLPPHMATPPRPYYPPASTSTPPFPYPPPPAGGSAYYSHTPPNSYYASPHQPSPSPTYYAPPPPASSAQAQRSKGNEYLLSLTTSISNLDLQGGPTGGGSMGVDGRLRHHSAPEGAGMSPVSPNYNKRLPPLPPPMPPRPQTEYLAHGAPTPVYGTPPPAAASGPSNYHLTPPPVPPRPTSQPVADAFVYPVPVRSPPKTFRPSVHPLSRPLASDTADLQPPEVKTPRRPQSDPVVLSAGKAKGKGKGKEAAEKNKAEKKSKDKENVGRKSPTKSKAAAKERPASASARPSLRRKSKSDEDYNPIIDLTLVTSDSDPESPRRRAANITPRSPARRKRATSELPSPTKHLTSPSPTTTPRGRRGASPSKASGAGTPSKPSTPSTAVQCSGFTRTGQPCKRLVKVEAPYLVARDQNRASDGSDEGDEVEGDVRSERVMGRYCKDHAGMICNAKGFYWRGKGRKAGVWVDFGDYIPLDIGQQTQTLLRMTMESNLTAKEEPGFLYAYELKDLETDDLSVYKVGRTDNVPRRISQWTHQCQSKTPILLDIFPLPPTPPRHRTTSSPASLQRSGTLTTSFLPGATTHRTPPLLAMKRWERLVHLELSDRCASHATSKAAFERVRMKCPDCGTSHKEMFPLMKAGGKGVYGDVAECVERWGKFIRVICGETEVV
ncbi:hypothetical protein IAT38_004686 [Cryptococcus sp. DSM 104549]